MRPEACGDVEPGFLVFYFQENMTRRYWTAAIGALLLGLAACGKKEPSSVTPDLAAPEPVRPAPEKVAAQAEVKASSGPVELTLLLHKTEIKLGESLWHQLRIRNVGKKELLVTDPTFFDPWQLRRGIRGHFGIFIEVLGPDGKPMKSEPHPNWGPGLPPSDKPSGLLEVHGPQEQAMVDGWKKRGYSSQQISEKLVGFNMGKRIAAETEKETPKAVLQPGESIETKSWSFYSEWEQFKKRPAPQPVGDFAELEFYDLDKPGKYKVRAVYDLAPSRKLMKMRGRIPVAPEEVLVRTPWIQVRVLP